MSGREGTGRWLGHLLALAAVVIWAGNFVAARGLRDDITPVALSFWRWIVALLVLVPFALRVPARDWRPVRTHLRYLALTALLGVTAFNTLVYVAGRTTSATNLALLAVATPIVILVLTRIVDGARITPLRLVGMAVAVLGVLVLVTGGSPAAVAGLRFNAGDLWMLLGTVAFASYTVLVRRKPPELTAVPFLVSTFGLGALFLVPLLVVELLLVGGRTVLNGTVVWSLLYVGVLSSTVAFALWNRAVASIGADRAGIVYYLEPVATAVAAALLLAETPGVAQGIAMALIVAGVFVSSRSGRPASPRP